MLKLRYVNPHYSAGLERLGLLSESALSRWDRGERIVVKNWADVFRCALDGIGTVYVKRHFRQRNRLFGVLRKNAAIREFDSSMRMRALGIPQAEPVLAALVCGRTGTTRFGVYIMREVEEAVGLDVLLARLVESPDESLLASIADELVRLLGVMHAGGFCHWDFKPRNLLVTRREALVITPIDSRSGRRMNLLTRRACIKRDYRFLLREPALKPFIEERMERLLNSFAHGSGGGSARA